MPSQLTSQKLLIFPSLTSQKLIIFPSLTSQKLPTNYFFLVRILAECSAHSTHCTTLVIVSEIPISILARCLEP